MLRRLFTGYTSSPPGTLMGAVLFLLLSVYGGSGAPWCCPTAPRVFVSGVAVADCFETFNCDVSPVADFGLEYLLG